MHTKPEAAARGRISKKTLDRQIAAGVGPRVTRIGRRVLFTDADLNAWLDRCREG